MKTWSLWPKTYPHCFPTWKGWFHSCGILQMGFSKLSIQLWWSWSSLISLIAKGTIKTQCCWVWQGQNVVSCIMVLWMCVRRTRCISTIVCVKWWIASILLLRYNSEYFVKYQNKMLEKTKDSLKYWKCQLDDVWRWVCWNYVNGHSSCKNH